MASTAVQNKWKAILKQGAEAEDMTLDWDSIQSVDHFQVARKNFRDEYEMLDLSIYLTSLEDVDDRAYDEALNEKITNGDILFYKNAAAMNPTVFAYRGEEREIVGAIPVAEGDELLVAPQGELPENRQPRRPAVLEGVPWRAERAVMPKELGGFSQLNNWLCNKILGRDSAKMTRYKQGVEEYQRKLCKLENFNDKADIQNPFRAAMSAEKLHEFKAEQKAMQKKDMFARLQEFDKRSDERLEDEFVMGDPEGQKLLHERREKEKQAELDQKAALENKKQEEEALEQLEKQALENEGLALFRELQKEMFDHRDKEEQERVERVNSIHDPELKSMVDACWRVHALFGQEVSPALLDEVKCANSFEGMEWHPKPNSFKRDHLSERHMPFLKLLTTLSAMQAPPEGTQYHHDLKQRQEKDALCAKLQNPNKLNTLYGIGSLFEHTLSGRPAPDDNKILRKVIWQGNILFNDVAMKAYAEGNPAPLGTCMKNGVLATLSYLGTLCVDDFQNDAARWPVAAKLMKETLSIMTECPTLAENMRLDKNTVNAITGWAQISDTMEKANMADIQCNDKSFPSLSPEKKQEIEHDILQGHQTKAMLLGFAAETLAVTEMEAQLGIMAADYYDKTNLRMQHKALFKTNSHVAELGKHHHAPENELLGKEPQEKVGIEPNQPQAKAKGIGL